MAQDTPLSVRNLVIYEIYVRNHTPQGDFAGVPLDLFQRIDIALGSLTIVELGAEAPLFRTIGEVPEEGTRQWTEKP